MLAATLGGCGSRGRDLLRQKSKSRGPGDAPLQAYARRALRPHPGCRTARSWRGIVFPLRTSHGGRMTVTIGRRELLVALGGAAVAWPLAARAQGDRIRRLLLMSTGERDPETQLRVGAFREGL